MPTMKCLPGRFGKITGFSLVELMIAIVVGLVVVGGVISIFASAVKSHTDNLRMTRLNQELRTTMTLMTRELRRAGFWGGEKRNAGTQGILNTLATQTGAGDGNEFDRLNFSGVNCITFSYDEDNNGSRAATTEHRGFRLNNGTVDSGTRTTPGCGGSWDPISNPDAIVITALTFAPSAAVNADIDGVDPPATVPCRSPAMPGVVGCVAGGPRNVTPAGVVSSQEITITLTGQLAGDSSVTRTLQETVRIYQ